MEKLAYLFYTNNFIQDRFVYQKMCASCKKM